MAVSPARAVAFEILLRVEREESYAAELLHSARLAKLPSRDHGLATELVMGVLRWQSLLDRRLAAASSQQLERLDGEVLAALRLGVYQLQFLSRVPARAAIFESVELAKAARKRSAAPFVNAVLRKIAGAGAEDIFAEIGQSPDSMTLAQNAAHPPWLVARWIEHYGLEATRQICIQDQTVPGAAIHIHGDESCVDQVNQISQTDAELAAAGVQLSPARLLSAARRVLSGDVTGTRAYREGRISIQDEASQLVALLVGRGEKIVDCTILDCCAAPGGKTALLARRSPRAKVLATELHPHRARLMQNLNRLPNVHVVAADARHLPFSLSFTFDLILVDVPCSGTGTLARNPEIKWRLKVEDLHDLQLRQLAILKSALTRLATGGRLVYSTCSLEHEENEAVVEAALEGTAEFKVADLKGELEQLRQCGEMCWEDIASLLAGPYLRTIPGVHPCDGFFAALIERR
ncbi:MAG TPA: 16S rRNA (cytosine(967)-C(5))-methyltransferase RsmB [Terriglobales bacterium]|jgi:16S rRNA (cytosine967-C5)-methyltransferase|nr:16S rRNA (cytosine(967)-C(5))-methyltransferase RsmB [Terriglobales bacterium]